MRPFPSLFKDFGHIDIRAARMDDKRQLGAARSINMGRENPVAGLSFGA